MTVFLASVDTLPPIGESKLYANFKGLLRGNKVSSLIVGNTNGASNCSTCIAFSNVHVSRTDFVKAKCTLAPCHPRYPPGPTGILPREVFKPIKPLKLAGIRIDPPPSLAVTIGTIPAFNAAAAPPLEPPGFKSLLKGE